MASSPLVRPDAAEDRGAPRDAASAPRFLTLKEVCRRTGLGRTTIEKLIAAGTFPAKVYVTPAIVRWDAAEIDRWIDGRIAARGGR